jgi:AraC-like DNA-binding protein
MICYQPAIWWKRPDNAMPVKIVNISVMNLNATGLAIGEIALHCGFANAFHFSRKLRQVYGESPRRWRAGAWKSGH